MLKDEVKRLYRRWLNELWGGDEASIYRSISEIISPDYVGHWPERTVNGPVELAEWVSTGVTYFDDLVPVLQVGPIIDDEVGLLAARWLLTGRYAGGLPEATVPVGTAVSICHFDVMRYAGGRFVESWAGSDQVIGLKQLGATSLAGCQWFDAEASAAR